MSDVVEYAPQLDGEPDPGEVVWGWVPFEEDARQGKDRPVLLVGHTLVDGEQSCHPTKPHAPPLRSSAHASAGTPERLWAGLMLTSKDHHRDAADEARHGRHWMDIGTGGWDRERRPSEVRLDRLIVLRDDAIRREGAVVSREVFDRVVAAARQYHALT